MAAPSENQFWKLRSKHGRDKLFATPELLWEAACEYFQWCDDNPLIENKVINSSKEGVIDHPSPKMRAYTLNGLCLYLDCSDGYFRAFKSTSDEQNDKDFLTVISHIEKVIYEQQFTAAAADLLNANIISRSLGLSDKKDHTVNTEQRLFSDDD
ncbi:MAG: DNA-packaging protein [Colwellia sp.]|nr:DNA-packaging protein [Colwellia sp.]